MLNFILQIHFSNCSSGPTARTLTHVINTNKLRAPHPAYVPDYAQHNTISNNHQIPHTSYFQFSSTPAIFIFPCIQLFSYQRMFLSGHGRNVLDMDGHNDQLTKSVLRVSSNTQMQRHGDLQCRTHGVFWMLFSDK